VRQLAERYPPDRGTQLTAAPVGHFIGMLNAFLIPLLDGSPVNLADAWDPARVLALMASDGLTVGGGAPYYLTSLLDHPDFTRGGENISATEVEEVLLALPGVAEAAVVAAPDARLGEHAAAVLRLAPGRPVPSLGQVRAHFEAAGLARPKWPEEVHAVDDFPRTASGKVQKFVLRADIAARQNRE
jgi:acyl-coenzyme A synthetase/AMP-(fatty) acid ligase